MIVRFAFPLVLAAILLGSCATLSEEECQYSDWELLGRQDGIDGADVSKFQTYVRECGRYGTPPDPVAWQTGWEEGLKTFCTPGGIYAAGIRGRGNAGLCGFEPDLVRIHRTAERYAQREAELLQARRAYDDLFEQRRWVRRDIDRLRFALRDDDLSDEDRNELRRDLDRAFLWLEDLERQEFLMRFRLVELERDLNEARRDLTAVELEFGLGGGVRRF